MHCLQLLDIPLLGKTVLNIVPFYVKQADQSQIVYTTRHDHLGLSFHN